MFPSVRRLVGLIVLCGASAVSAPVSAVPHHGNPAEPPGGVVELECTEAWRRGQDDDDLFFGAVQTLALGPDGNIYVLDQQLSQVIVLAPDGELVRTLSREGEGPGESRRPEDMVFLPDGSLGLAQYINGRIIRIDLAGAPLETWMPPGYSPEGGGMYSIRRVRSRGGSLVINGAKVVPADDGMLRTQFLVRCNMAGEVEAEILAREVAARLQREGWVEKRNYFPSHERWDIDAEGNILAAPERNAYRVVVYGQDGRPLRSFGREHTPWRRTAEEKQRLRDAVTVIRDGQRMDIPVVVEDDEPAIAALSVRPDGEIWVLPGAGTKDQPEGIMLSWDAFAPDGTFRRQIRVKCPGDPDEDKLVLLDDHRLALVRGAVQARRAAFGGSRGDTDAVAVHDLIVYTF